MTLTPGKRGTVVLRAVPRPGADPLMEAAAGQLKEGCDPYRLVLPAERETLAEYYADELRGALDRGRRSPPSASWWTPPEAPLHFKAYDGKASFDGDAVSFRWFWTGASSAKWKAGDQTFPVAELSGVEWRSPEVFEGHLRLLRRRARRRRSPPRRTRTRRRSSSGSATGRSTSRCRSPRRCWRPCAPRGPRRWSRPTAAPRRDPGRHRRPDPAPRGAAPRRGWSRTRSSPRRRRSCWRSCERARAPALRGTPRGYSRSLPAR